MDASLIRKVTGNFPPRVFRPVRGGGGLSAKLWGRAAEEPYFGAAVRKIPYTVVIPMLEDALQDKCVLVIMRK